MTPLLPVALALATAIAAPAAAQTATAGVERLPLAYPDALARVEGGALVWRDGSRTEVSDGDPKKPLDLWLARASVTDMFRWPYPQGTPLAPPEGGRDPGRARNAELFTRLYGDCGKGEVAPLLVEVVWLPSRYGKPVKVSPRHGMADRLRAVSARLDRLPPRFDRYLYPPAGTYNCRPVAGESRLSAHGYGIAIDLPVGVASYWRWDGATGRAAHGGLPAWHNLIPAEVVAAFEAEGFIWGGRWSHYDTMHFEYRPEMFER